MSASLSFLGSAGVGSPVYASSANPLPVTAISAAAGSVGTQATTITSTTAETTIVTANATKKIYIYGLVIANSSATATLVSFKDATSGTTRFTFYVPAGDTRGFMLPPDGGWLQAAVNNNWTATCGTSVASVIISALYTLV